MRTWCACDQIMLTYKSCTSLFQDVTALVIQAAGGGIAASATDEQGTKLVRNDLNCLIERISDIRDRAPILCWLALPFN